MWIIASVPPLTSWFVLNMYPANGAKSRVCRMPGVNVMVVQLYSRAEKLANQCKKAMG